MIATTFRVLVCDDDQPIRNLFSMILKGSGYHVEVAIDGKDALSKINDPNKFDAILTDSCMPQMDGFGLVSALRELQYPGKILVISGFLDEKSKAAYQRLNVDRIVSKQDGVRGLANILKECLASGQALPKTMENPRRA